MSLLDTASLICTPNGYKEGKLYSVIPSDGSGDLSVTRATTATRVNSAGLVELVPYNLLQYSQDFSNAYWFGEPGNTITSNTTTAPDGTLTADTFTATAGNEINVHNLNGFSLADGTFTYSIYLKNNGTNLIEAYLFKVGVGFAARGEINFSAGTFTASIGTGSIENVGNGWFRVSLTNTYTSGTFTTGTYTTSTTGTRSVFAWGAQLVEGSVAKDYQKTETRLNIPRLDYSNGTCPSILVEPQRTNLFLYSANLANASWSTYAVSGTITRTANYATAPDGTMTATRIQNSGGTEVQWTYQNISLPSNGVLTMYVKRTGSTNQTFRFFANNGAAFTGTLTATDEWQRLEFAVSSNGGALPFGITNDFQGNACDILVWGAQLEAGSYATSYIPTTSASVTRNADVISKTGISSLIGQTEGTLFIDTYIDNIAAQTNDPVLLYVKGSVAEAYIEINDAGGVYGVFFDGTSAIGFIFANIGLTNGRHKFAFGYKNNDFVLYVDGVQVGTDTSGAVSGSLTEFGLQYYDNFYRGAQEINASALWTTRLTNTQLAQLTTI